MSLTSLLTDRTKQLSAEVDEIHFTFDGFIYNPLDYAWEPHRDYLARYVKKDCQVMFLGMNPGPYGMMQTGVPFGEINTVKDYLKITGKVGKPGVEHPARPVLGFDCKRSEVSGRRLWGLIRTMFPDCDFSSFCCIMNYCPFGFLEGGKTAKNFTPDHLPKEERVKLDRVCDAYLKDVVELVKPKFLMGVGKYAMEKFENLFDGKYPVSSIIHPSPGNPQANNNWEGKTLDKLRECGLWK